ncbi:hypothetical protein ATPR_3082 [Acetobacter tropicalis NBRC 101654]|uniref:Uncharacterized protein n=1 Tax=Acetobacter tropicalis NBRC 101654 TaxID=749388 RepID=F7VI83_9PROT|nr:hypothetical protein ATPR_3082 [Acetobacter tropicalis NBRC 101654]
MVWKPEANRLSVTLPRLKKRQSGGEALNMVSKAFSPSTIGSAAGSPCIFTQDAGFFFCQPVMLEAS